MNQKHIIELFPDKDNCIETIAKKEYDSLTDIYLKTGQYDNDFEVKFELLRTFLESFNFKKLRKKSDIYLNKGLQIKFIVFRDQETVKYKIIPR